MARGSYQPVDRDAEAQCIVDRGGIAREVGTRAAYLIPNLHYYAHPRVGCECDDWRFNRPTGGCAHMRAAGIMEQRDRAAAHAARLQQRAAR